MRQKAVGASAAAILATAPFGGLTTVDEPAVEAVGLDHPVAVGPFEVTVTGAYTAPTHPAVWAAEDEQAFVLTFDVTGTGMRAERGILFSDAVTPPAGAGLRADAPAVLVTADDLISLDWVNPEVTYHVELAWAQEQGWSEDHVVVTLQELTWVEDTLFRLQGERWQDLNVPLATVTVPVEQQEAQ